MSVLKNTTFEYCMQKSQRVTFFFQVDVLKSFFQHMRILILEIYTKCNDGGFRVGKVRFWVCPP